MGSYTHHTNQKCEKYDPYMNVWSELPQLNVGRGGASTCMYDNKYIYIFGGQTGDSKKEPVKEIEVFSQEFYLWRIVPLAK